MLKCEDKVKLEMPSVVNEISQTVLTMLYYPLIKHRAYVLYQILISLSMSHSKFENHRIIQELSGFSIEVIEQERKVLEKYQLLKTYYDANKKQYLYVILSPKSGSSFLEHEVFGRMYLNMMGEQVVRFQKKVFLKEMVDKNNYLDISESIHDVLKDDWNEAYEQTYLEVKQEIKKQKESEIVFNYDEFLKDLSDLIWPKKKRSQKQLEEIGRIATVYGISPKRMRILVSNAIENGTLNMKKLKERSAISKAKFETDEVNIYKWPPIRFLQNKQHGIPVSKADGETIRILLEEYRLIPEVCNVLIDYVLQNNDQKFVRNYVEAIAASWVRAQIDTYEKAVERIHKPNNLKDTSSKVALDKKEASMSDEERKRLLDEIKQMRGK